MSKQAYNHIHIYQAVSEARKMYKCTVPECNHTVNAVIMPGRKAMCGVCRMTLVIEEENLRRKNIAHIGCGVKVGSAKAFDTKQSQSPLAKPSDISALLDRVRREI